MQDSPYASQRCDLMCFAELLLCCAVMLNFFHDNLEPYDTVEHGCMSMWLEETELDKNGDNLGEQNK